MANKAFEIQNSTLRIGGVDLQAGNTSIVIPGVTQAANYRVEEVEDTDDQTYQFTPDSGVVVIDAALYNAIVNELADDHFADYTAPTDDEGYIDEIEVNGRGTYTEQESNTAKNNDMYAYVGSSSASDRPIVPEDWIQVPFRPKMRAGAIENIGGGSGGNGLVEREINFPTGEEGDTKGTLALTPDGVYVCTADWENTSESFEATTSEEYLSSQSVNQYVAFHIPQSEYQNLAELIDFNKPGNWTVSAELDGVEGTGPWEVVELGTWNFTLGDYQGQQGWVFYIASFGSLITVPDGTYFELNYVDQANIWEPLSQGNLRIDTWGYPGDNPVRLTHTTPGESILIQSTDGDNNGRSSLRWHIRPEPDGNGSLYSQVDVQNDGVWIKNADWGQEGYSHYWHFDNSGNLTFPDGTIQTTAYTGQSGGGTGVTYYVMANSDGNVVTSTDGISWSSPVVITPSGINQVATNGTNIVYIDGSTVGFTSFAAPSTATERTAAVDGMTNVNLNQITYGGGYFVVAGQCNNGSVDWPLYGYSTDGDTWTFKVITDGALQATLANNNNENSSFSDVDYNGVGFNFAVSGDNVGGGVYTTDITETFTETNYFGMTPGYQVAWNGDAWYYFNNDVGSGINTNRDPRTGNWDGPFNPWGTSDLDVGYMLGGETSNTFCGGDGVLAVSDGSGHITYSTNNGANWTVVTPIPYTTTAFSISQQNAAVITFTNMAQQPGTAPASFITESPAYNNEKVVITNAGEYNGTYYVNFISDNAFTLCTDQGLTTPLDSSGFAAFSSGTVTFSHGMYIDAMDYANGYFYMGNDNDQIARSRSTNMGSWVIVDDQNNAFEYWNDFFGYTDTGSLGTSLTNNGYSVTLNSDGTIELPSLSMTSYEPGYTINGPTLQMGNDPTVGETIITGPAPDSNNPSARRLIIQGQRGWGGWGDSAVGEGGDIYLWAGTGGENSNGSVGSGGDIKIRGGVGQAGESNGAWTEGGYIKIEGGDVQYGYGTGGPIDINAGSTNQGNGGAGDGGNVNIRAGQGSVNNGEVHIYTSSNGSNYDNEWIFKNDGTLQLPSGTPLNADLNGYGNDPGTGFKYTFTADYNSLQSNGTGTITGVVLSDGYISTIVAGCIITFRNGETRIINGGTTDGQTTGAALYTWDGAEVVSEWTNPAFPITIESGDYVPSTKKTAKINPDTDYVSLGQYMEIYTGGAPSTMDDLGHIHMKGHTGNVELFLGTDDNFVSSKEAGTTPGHVSMRSETEIKVIETALRTTRNGSTFVSDYGDNYNYLWALDNYNDISHNCVTTDPDGNYYIGGEHHTTADAMISKFSKDGELIWSKLVGSDAWNANAIAYNPSLGQVGVACTANPDRSHEYIKLVTFTSDGQEVSTQDFYDVDNGIYPTDMALHPTLGWIVSANSYGEEVVKAGLTPQTGSGVGLLILNASATTILGDLMSAPDTSWKISGTNITGKQTLGSAIGAFTNISLVNDTVANPAAGGAVITVRIDYKNGVYYDISEVTAVGSNYTAGDTLRVTGDLLGGTTPTNDVVFTITENGYGELQGGTAAGTPSLSTIRLDMTAIGFTTEDFSTGTYSIHRQVGQRPVVLTSTWRKFLDLEDGDAYTEGWSTTVYVDSANNVFVGGAMNSSINNGSGCGYVWKLNSSGVTQWVSGLANPFNVTSIATDSYGFVYASTSNFYGGGNEIYKLDDQGAYSLYRYDNGPYGSWSAHLDIARDETGDEYLYVGLSGFFAMFSSADGFAVQKFDLALTPVWARYMEMSNGQNMSVDYANNFQHFALTSTQAAIVGYSYILGTDYDNGMISSLCITNDFVADTEGTSGIITKTVDLAWSFDSAPSITDLIALGVEGLDSSVEYEADPTALTWYNHRFQCRIINGNYEVKGIVGVDNIKFINGDNLDHNPSDIPESTQNVQLNWEITLTPGDRGKFIKNQHAPGVGWVQNLTINVPKSDAEFPVGSIITLLNLDTSDNYRIYVQPVDWGQSSAARIWATGYLNPSIWSFGGMQTATLMKISPDDWLLTANNISNED